MKKVLLFALLLTLSVSMLVAGSRITIKGSDTLVRLGQRWAEEYMKHDKTAVIQVAGEPSDLGGSS